MVFMLRAIIVSGGDVGNPEVLQGEASITDIFWPLTLISNGNNRVILAFDLIYRESLKSLISRLWFST